jgi:hypothetical protein
MNMNSQLLGGITGFTRGATIANVTVTADLPGVLGSYPFLSSNRGPSMKKQANTDNRARAPGKLLGDAGEHYALSQFSFVGKYAAKMPDNWEAYDLAVETGRGLVRVSVKTRSESLGWKSSRWFNFDDRKDCDWMVFIFKPASGFVRSWVVPYPVVKAHSNVPGPSRKDAWFRDLGWNKLTREPLASYENNWSLNESPHTRPAAPVAPTVS